MWMHNDRPVFQDASLSREELIDVEHALAKEFRRVFRFESSSLYFPDADVGHSELWQKLLRCRAVVLAEESRILLPLCVANALLGVFVAKDVAPESLDIPEDTAGHIAAMVMEKILLSKQSVTDPDTGLFNRSFFMQRLECDIERLRTQTFTLGEDMEGDDPQAFSTPALIVVEAEYALDKQQGFGAHNDEEKTLVLSAAFQEALKKDGVEDALLGVLGMGRLGALVQGRNGKRLDALMKAFTEQASRRLLHDPFMDRDIPLQVHAGAAVFPADMDGRNAGMPVKAQAAALLQRAERALSAAKKHGVPSALRFGRIAEEGGIVLGVAPMDRLTVSLGRETGASEGSLYTVWSPEGGPDAVCRGEIVLTQVDAESSTAEVLHPADMGDPVRPGDRLRRQAAEKTCVLPVDEEPARKDLVTGLYPYRDFLRIQPELLQNRAAFSFLLLRVHQEDGPVEPVEDAEASIFKLVEYAQNILGADSVGGRFGLLGTVFFVPHEGDKEAAQIVEKAKTLLDHLEQEAGLKLTCGLASWPYLNFKRRAALENCRKALQYAMLPAAALESSPWGRPHLGVFDGTALTISADGHFSRGDIYEAMEEYKLALIADPANSVARNSLGICLAGIGHLDKARVCFERVLEKEPSNMMALYNLGQALMRSSQTDKAKASFEACLRIDSRHLFSLLRLGGMAMDEGRMQTAAHYYELASKSPGGEGVSNRYKARPAMAQGKRAEAKEYLHLALLHDPKDAMSMHLLATLYLEDGEDPKIAESLARKSMALNPERSAFRELLAKALEAQGKENEARQVSARSASNL
jgi:tetratricopeptide (TPR) repeat protein/GGDEF domain-containing protein